MKNIIFACMLIGTLMSFDNVHVIGISMEKQTDYIMRWAEFKFKEAQWRVKFSDNLCPEFTEIIIIDEVRYCTENFRMPVPPLPPVTVCEVSRNHEGCNYRPPLVEDGTPTLPEDLSTPIQDDSRGTINPNCDENPALCLPPTICDLPQNEFLSNCLVNKPDCSLDVNYDNPLCVYASKCELEQYKNLPGCQDPNPCRTHPELCLTICDREENAKSRRCLIERCTIFPALPECKEVEECIVKPECLGDDTLTDNQCCPQRICNPTCEEHGVNCPPPPPEEECKWGYHLGTAITDILVEPIQKQEMDQDGIQGFLQCYNEYVKTKNQISLKCFHESVANCYTALTESLAVTIQKLTQGYDTVTVTEDTKEAKTITLEKNQVNPGRN